MTWTLRPEELPPSLLTDLTGRPAASGPGSAGGDGGGATGRATGPRVAAARRVDGSTWLEELPRRVADALERWDLRRDGAVPLRAGYTALVVPVLRPRGDAGALKVGWPHPESDTEHLALRAWAGRGAVTLLAADPAGSTLLLERLDADRDLMTGSVLDTTEALGHLVRALDRPAPPWAPRLSAQLDRVQQRLARFQAEPGAARQFPRRLVQHAASVVADLLAEGPDALDARLVHTDLHQMNVLWRPDPGEWVAIDPKPMAADPHWAVAPALWNRWDDVLAAHDARAHLQLRLGILCEAAGLDEDRARAMTIVRQVDNAVWAIDSDLAARGDWVSKAVAVVKAMQPG